MGIGWLKGELGTKIEWDDVASSLSGCLVKAASDDASDVKE